MSKVLSTPLDPHCCRSPCLAPFLCLCHLLKGGDCSNARACAVAYPCAVRQGLLWVRPTPLPSPLVGDSGAAAAQQLLDTSDIPIVPELEEEGWASQVVAPMGGGRAEWLGIALGPGVGALQSEQAGYPPQHSCNSS